MLPTPTDTIFRLLCQARAIASLAASKPIFGQRSPARRAHLGETITVPPLPMPRTFWPGCGCTGGPRWHRRDRHGHIPCDKVERFEEGRSGRRSEPSDGSHLGNDKGDILRETYRLGIHRPRLHVVFSRTDHPRVEGRSRLAHLYARVAWRSRGGPTWFGPPSGRGRRSCGGDEGQPTLPRGERVRDKGKEKENETEGAFNHEALQRDGYTRHAHIQLHQEKERFHRPHAATEKGDREQVCRVPRRGA